MQNYKNINLNEICSCLYFSYHDEHLSPVPLPLHIFLYEKRNISYSQFKAFNISTNRRI